MQTQDPFWIAVMNTENTRSTAFGATPQEALSALLVLWIEKHCANSEAWPAYPWTRKDEVELGHARVGGAYILSNHDRFYYPEMLGGDSPSLAATWEEVAGKYGIDPNAKMPSPDQRLLATCNEVAGREGADVVVTRLQAFLVRLAREGRTHLDLDRVAQAVESGR